METVTTIIGALGFPIVACIFMWRFINDTLREFTRAMDENTQMLARMADRFDMWREEDDSKHAEH